MEKLSIITRTKNRPNLLKNALSSLSNQTYKNLEVIVVNDGGRNVDHILKEFEPNLKIKYVVHSKSLGRGAALVSGGKMAEGDWIGILDDDDVVYPNHYEGLLKHASSELGVVYSNYKIVLIDGNQIVNSRAVQTPTYIRYQDILIEDRVPTCTMILNRKCFEVCGYWREDLYVQEDYEFLIRVREKFEFKHVNQTTAEYRVYVDYDNSSTLDRDKYAIYLKKVYSMHPTDDPRILNARQGLLNLLSAQAKHVHKLWELHKAGKMTAKKVRRQIMAAIFGL